MKNTNDVPVVNSFRFAVDVPMYDDGDNVSLDDWYVDKNVKLEPYGNGFVDKIGVNTNNGPNSFLSPPPSKRLKILPSSSSTKKLTQQMPGVRKEVYKNDEDDGNETKTRIYITRTSAKQIKIEEL